MTNQQPKKKRGSLGKIIGIIIFSIPIVFGALFMYELSLKQELLLTSDSPKSVNKIEVIEVGEPINEGPSAIRIKSKSDKIEVGLHDNGAILDETNFEIVWENDTAATITLTGSGQEPTIVKYQTDADEVFEVLEDGLK